MIIHFGARYQATRPAKNDQQRAYAAGSPAMGVRDFRCAHVRPAI
jgi:hypothetical protein